MRVVITGGAGFIGCNLAADLLGRGNEVLLYDNLSRRGSEDNLAWVRSLGPARLMREDVRDADAVERALQIVGDVDAVVHLAAQVAVTDSVSDPRTDFEVNALGTLNVLEAVRASRARPVLLFASTNKVYGDLEDLSASVWGKRYVCPASSVGIGESRPLDLHSPYGCSKGSADQYVRDYARIYGLRTVVLRQSCIYGHRQFGVEEQGWLAWFALAALSGQPISVYGDGYQVRDVLDVADLMRLYRLCLEQIGSVSGAVLNVGGGPQNALSIVEAIELLERHLSCRVERRYADWRPGDQRFFISSNHEAERRLGWRPQIGIEQGLPRLIRWVAGNLERIKRVASAGRL